MVTYSWLLEFLRVGPKLVHWIAMEGGVKKKKKLEAFVLKSTVPLVDYFLLVRTAIFVASFRIFRRG